MEFRGEDISWFLSTPEEFGGWGGVKLRIDRDINKFVYTLNKKSKLHLKIAITASPLNNIS